ncbi:hypothetical protein JCM10296v2_007849 [Rhodotorula toruloides]
MDSGDEHYELDAEAHHHDSFDEQLEHGYDELEKAMSSGRHELKEEEESLWEAWRELVSGNCQAEGLFDKSHPDPGVCADLHNLANAYRASHGASLARPPNPVDKASPHLTAFLCKSPTTVSNLLVAINLSCQDKLGTTDHTARYELIQWVEGIEAFFGIKARDRFSTHDRWRDASIREREGVINFLWGALRLLEFGDCSPHHLVGPFLAQRARAPTYVDDRLQPDWRKNSAFKSIGDTYDLLGATQSLRDRSPPRNSCRDRRDPHGRRFNE